MAEENFTESVESLVRAVTGKMPVDFMLFLGAGASIKSGVPSGWQCIWYWKQSLFLSAHPTLNKTLVSDISDPRIQQRIQAWLASVPGMPPNGSPEEYGFYVEKCYPRAEDRRRYFERISQVDKPSLGYRALGRMLECGQFRWLWTTNFDSLVQRGRPEGARRPFRVAGLDSTHRLQFLTERDEYATLVHLHGDYRYDALKNTSDEVRSLDAHFVRNICKLAEDLPLLVVGYGGGDRSIMTALTEAYGRRGRGALYWTVMRDVRPAASVTELIKLANDWGHHARIVEFDGFDDLMIRFAQSLLTPEEHASFVKERHANSVRKAAPFSMGSYPGRSGVVKSNLWELALPEEYWTCPRPESFTWPDLRDKVAGHPVVAGLAGKRVIALGSPNALREAFGLKEGDVGQERFAKPDMEPDSVMQGVIAEYVARGLAGTQYRVAYTRGAWAIYDPMTATAAGSGCSVVRAALVSAHFRDQTPVLSIVPDRHVFSTVPGGEVPDSLRRQVKQELSRQYNKQFNDELAHWRTALGLAAGERACALGKDTGSSRMVVRRGPQFVEVLSADHTVRAETTVHGDYLKLRAIQLKEPSLRFARGTDTHPLRGLLDRGPVEALLPRLDNLPLMLGVCSGRLDSPLLEEFLREVAGGHDAVETKDDYLVPYPGFRTAFGLDLKVGSARGHVRFDEKLPDGPSAGRQREALSRVCEAILNASKAGASVVLVVVPDGWDDIELVETEGSPSLNFHHLIKAFAAPHGIRTQLLRLSTLEKRQRLEVVWWLALAVFAKSNRTPWTRDATDDGTVHVGIGYGLDHSDPRKRVVMCCSHIYQANGLGLKFQLSEIGSRAFFKRKNPFLTREDAFRVGERALQAVFESRHALPKRVCISKRTPFTRDEQEGFCGALERVAEVELLTVEMEDGARLVRAVKEGTSPDWYPVQRGTVVQYGSHEALVWVHGDTTGISSKFGGAHYYQGKSRIPGPLRVTRFVGDSPIEEIAADLLGLSKMDWNSFDLYGKMPVHLSSPGRIAEVARLLGDIRLEDRDYRLFM